MRRFIPLVWLFILGCPQPVETQPKPVAVSPPGGSQPAAMDRSALDSRPLVRGGAGTWQAEAPVDTSGVEAGSVCADCDVVLVTMCSVRRDHVDVYQNRGLTPNLNRIAQGGYRFDTAYAASNFTLASLTAILTGRFGSSTGVVGWDKGLVSDVPTLPEILGIYGYKTAGFTINAASGFRPEYGLSRGFQHLEIIEAPSDNPDGRQASGPTGTALSVKPMAKWIESQPKDQRIFAMLHTRTAHFPFVVAPPDPASDPTGVGRLLWGDDLAPGQNRGQMPGVAGGTQVQGVGVSTDPNQLRDFVRKAGPKGLEVWSAHYADSMTRLDADLGAVLDVLERTGRLDKTILVVVADHGESLGDHDELLHGDSYFDPVVHVPLLVRVPGLPGTGKGLSNLVSHVDLLPTILDLVGAVAPSGIDGESMTPMLRDPNVEIRSTALVEGGVSWTPRDSMRGAVISPPYALLRQPLVCSMRTVEPPPKPGEPFTCLYDMRTDPDQQHNIARTSPEIAAQLQERWDGFRKARSGQTVARELKIDPAFRALLQKSGYFNVSKPED
ncbi:MAG: hypothetical protein CL930_05845 [Deltaproteobacteria bacterium]|nr:hypothetical protein [Deltaproteobacteria bacterium]